MNPADSVLEAQALALLRRLAREQDSRCHRIRDDATEQATAIVRKARAEARARVRDAVVELRRGQQRALTQRRAALDTGARQRQQTALGDWLADAWAALPDVLLSRWERPSSRAQWCAAAMDAARRDLLDRGALTVEVDARWQDAVAPLVATDGAADRAVTMVPRPGLGAGLRIRAGHACVDATIAGLLAPRERIAAELLAELGRRRAVPASAVAP